MKVDTFPVLLFAVEALLEKGTSQKGKNLLLGNKFFPLKEDPIANEYQSIFDRMAFFICVFVPLKQI